MAEMLSQEEIDALLNGDASSSSEPQTDNNKSLTDHEIDALGEIGNISMGTSATTLFTLLGQKVTITTPRVSETTLRHLSDDYDLPCVAVKIEYREGIEGFNLLILKEEDVKIITDLMMGGDGRNIADELTDIHLSAIGEAMNQMIGSSCTSMSEIFNSKIDINPPDAFSLNFSNKDQKILDINPDQHLVRTAFNMKVGDLIDSEIMQIIPIDFAKKLVNPLLGEEEAPKQQAPQKKEVPVMAEELLVEEKEESISMSDRTLSREEPRTSYTKDDDYNYDYQEPPVRTHQNPVNVKPLQFESFDEDNSMPSEFNDIALIKDVPLEITVELGRTTRKISEILEFAPGTVVELDRLVGESLDILVNGKLIAKGEVVVVDENYGIRINDIINPRKRLSSC